MARHTKPHKCNFTECRAKNVGFATANDLDRHKKSGKHKLPPTKGSGKGYICCACPVQSNGKPKWWDRLDNFRSHVDRKHKELNKIWVVKTYVDSVRSLFKRLGADVAVAGLSAVSGPSTQ